MLRATLRTRVRLALLPIHTRTRLQWFQGDVHTSALIMPRNYVAPTGTRVTLSKISIELTRACFRCFLVHKESSENIPAFGDCHYRPRPEASRGRIDSTARKLACSSSSHTDTETYHVYSEIPSLCRASGIILESGFPSSPATWSFRL
jgi:hypothetical protein